MPISAASLQKEQFLRLLILSWPKRGATTHAVSTSPGPRRVLLCERSDSALEGAAEETTDFDFERVVGWDTITRFTVDAKREAKEGKLKTLIVDPFNFFADALMIECFQSTMTKEGNEDGRSAHPELVKRLAHIVNLLFTIPAHLVVVTHYMEVGGDEGGKPKAGEGLAPLMPSVKARSLVAAMFHNIVWFDVAPKDCPPEDHFNNRVFYTSSKGVFGPGCRALGKGIDMVPANVAGFIKRKEARDMHEGKKTNGAGVALKPMAAAPIAAKPQRPPITGRR